MKVGDLVNAAYIRGGHIGIYHSGIIIDIEKNEYNRWHLGGIETLIRILTSGGIMTFELSTDEFEVVNESR